MKKIIYLTYLIKIFAENIKKEKFINSFNFFNYNNKIIILTFIGIFIPGSIICYAIWKILGNSND